MMSNLVEGMETNTPSEPSLAGAASSPILRNASAVPDGSSAVPRNLSHLHEEIMRSEGVRSGEMKSSAPSCMWTAPMLPPLSARAVQTMSRAPFTALRSVPVTSMKRLRVSVVTVVRAPLIMGGNDSTLPSESLMMGYFSAPLSRSAYSRPFSCFSSISSRSISSVLARGTNLASLGSSREYVKGGTTLSRSCMPIASLLLLRPMVR